MKAAVYHGRRDVRVQEVQDPPDPGPGEVLLDVSFASICGTDLTEFLHGPKMVPLFEPHPASGHVGPLILGHEFTGRVVAAGADVAHLSVGDRVVPGAGSWCGTCSRCREGRPNLCLRYFVYGLHAPGGLAERVLVPARMCHEVPPDCSDQAAALAQPLAIALHAIARARVARGDSVAVVGVGGIGAFLVAAARAVAPALLIAVDPDAARLDVAMKLGADILLEPGREDVAQAIRHEAGGEGADVVIEASGTPAGLELAINAVRHGGRVHLVGLQAQPSTVDLHHCTVHEIDLSTSNGHVCLSDIPAALRVLSTRELAATVTGSVIGLDRLVEDGLEPMADQSAHGKIVVAVG
jgi:(R,R)-butanediol dehydrogenase/meso-butanediol dehydrogenase/diacetyl reductase